MSAEPRCRTVMGLRWSRSGFARPVECGKPATHTNGRKPPWTLHACAVHASAFDTPTPLSSTTEKTKP